MSTKRLLKNLEDTKLKGTKDILSLEQEVKYARDAIPHFQLEGIWVGKYVRSALLCIFTFCNLAFLKVILSFNVFLFSLCLSPDTACTDMR